MYVCVYVIMVGWMFGSIYVCMCARALAHVSNLSSENVLTFCVLIKIIYGVLTVKMTVRLIWILYRTKMEKGTLICKNKHRKTQKVDDLRPDEP